MDQLTRRLEDMREVQDPPGPLERLAQIPVAGATLAEALRQMEDQVTRAMLLPRYYYVRWTVVDTWHLVQTMPTQEQSATRALCGASPHWTVYSHQPREPLCAVCAAAAAWPASG